MKEQKQKARNKKFGLWGMPLVDFLLNTQTGCVIGSQMIRSGQRIEDQFGDITEMVGIGKGKKELLIVDL